METNCVVNNQIEVNPYCQNDKLVEFCQKNNIIVSAYGPVRYLKLEYYILTTLHHSDTYLSQSNILKNIICFFNYIP